MKKKLMVPKFKNEAEEAEFWASLNLVEYFEPSDFKRGVMFPNLKLTTRPITLRLPVGMIDRVKIQAHKMDIPYQSLIKKIIYDGLQSQL